MFGKQNLPLVYGLDLSPSTKRTGLKLSLSLVLLCAMLLTLAPQAWAVTGDIEPTNEDSALTGETTSFILSLGTDPEVSEVTANQSFSITVTAIDDNTDPVTDYTGTITFSSLDASATLPVDYTFVAEDLGVKTFDLGFTLVTSGEQTITVTDTTDALLFGEITLTVSGQAAVTASADQPVILTPSNGEVLNTATVDIVGTAPTSSVVTIYDGSISKGTATADAQGTFSFTTEALFDGTHTFVAEVDVAGQKVRSTEVQVTLDTTAPVIQHIQLTPPTAQASEKVDVTVETEGELSGLKLIVDQRTVTLSEGGVVGTYTGSFIAPSAAGEYAVDVEVTDKAGNTDTYQDQATLTVGGTGVTTETAPIAVSAADVVTGIAPLTVNFTSMGSFSSGASPTYSWDFGDSTPALSGETANHTYVNPGVYVATLTITDGSVSDTSTVGITVSNGVATPPPQTAENGPGAWALSIVAAMGLSYLWNRKAFRQTN